jgi:hypothetical protein
MGCVWPVDASVTDCILMRLVARTRAVRVRSLKMQQVICVGTRVIRLKSVDPSDQKFSWLANKSFWIISSRSLKDFN